jgi:hypothetical protein
MYKYLLLFIIILTLAFFTLQTHYLSEKMGHFGEFGGDRAVKFAETRRELIYDKQSRRILADLISAT